MKRVFLIDNYDSFTYNLVHYLEELHCDVTVKRNDQFDLDELEAFDHVVLSPGPGIPEESGLLKAAIERYAPTKNILGVCLGMQALALHTGGRLYNRKGIMHGRTTALKVLRDSALLKGITEFQVGLYHSWAVDKEALLGWALCAVALEEDAPMVIESEKDSAYGVQFHPESVLTPQGLRMIKNWLALVN